VNALSLFRPPHAIREADCIEPHNLQLRNVKRVAAAGELPQVVS